MQVKVLVSGIFERVPIMVVELMST